MAEVFGGMNLSGTVRSGRLAELSGTIDLASLKLAGRSVKHLRADLRKPADEPAMQLANLQAELARRRPGRPRSSSHSPIRAPHSMP